MCDIFLKEDVGRVLRGKSVLFLGDSIMRNIYKDFVYLSSKMTGNKFIPQEDMRTKGEKGFLEDNLTKNSTMNASRNYEEERDCYNKESDVQLSFMFITRCYSPELKEKMMGYSRSYGSYPDLIIVNSALWDINRWGPSGIPKYMENINKLMKLFKRILPEYTMVIWMTTPPISTEIRGGFTIKDLQFTKLSMRYNIMEGNNYCARTVASYGYDVLDMHHHMLDQIHRRANDGIHWNADAVRMQTNLILTHYCLTFKIPLPGRVKDPDAMKLLEETMRMASLAEEDFTYVGPKSGARSGRATTSSGDSGNSTASPNDRNRSPDHSDRSFEDEDRRHGARNQSHSRREKESPNDKERRSGARDQSHSRKEKESPKDKDRYDRGRTRERGSWKSGQEKDRKILKAKRRN